MGNELAAKLYSDTFRSLLVKSTLASMGRAADAGVTPVSMGAVTFQPEAFVPLLPTTTRTLTSTATSTATSTSSSSKWGPAQHGGGLLSVRPLLAELLQLARWRCRRRGRRAWKSQARRCRSAEAHTGA